MNSESPIIAVLVNGQSHRHISLLDRGLAYGDGVFETIQIKNGKALLWEQHKQRLLTGCRTLGIPFDDAEILDKETKQLITSLDCPAVLKLIITRGSSLRGYYAKPGIVPTRIFYLSEWQSFPEHYQHTGIDVTVCKHRLAHAPEIARIKHLNRLDQVLARNEWQEEYQEGLVCDQAGNIIEGTMSNLFICNEDTWITPDLNNCGVAGVMRQYIMEQAIKHGISVIEQTVSLDEVLQSDGAFLCNSLIGVWPIKTVSQQTIPLIKQLTELLRWIP